MTPAQAKRLFAIISYLVKKEMQPVNTVSFAGDVSMNEVCDIREYLKENNEIKPSYTSFMVKALAKALKEHPNMNRKIFPSLFGQKIVQFNDIDITVACEQQFPDAEMFAFIDTIRKVPEKQLREIQQNLVRLKNANENNNRQLKELFWLTKYFPAFISKRICYLPALFSSQWKKYRGGAAIISSPAKYGVDKIIGTWTHPVGLSFGLIENKPVVRDDDIVIEPVCTLTLNFDRRINAGAPAAKFFARIKEILENAKDELGYSHIYNEDSLQLAPTQNDKKIPTLVFS